MSRPEGWAADRFLDEAQMRELAVLPTSQEGASAGEAPPRVARPHIRKREAYDSADLLALFNEPDFLERALMRDRFVNPEQLEQWLAGIVAARRIEIVLEWDGRCVGFGAVYAQGEHFDHCGVLMLGVSSASRGRAFGQTLLVALLQASTRCLRLKKIQLTVLTDNVPAINLYRKNGFVCEGVLRRFVRRGNRYADAYAMAFLP